MSAWDNAKKAAKDFGWKGLVYGAAVGAAVGVAVLLSGAAILYGLSLAGLPGVAAELGIGGAAQAAGVATGMAAGGAHLLTGGLFAGMAAAGAVAGATIGGVGGVVTGATYGAAMDESNPMPNVMEKAARKIVEKAPHLAKSVAVKVNNEQAASMQVAQLSTVKPAPAPEAPVLSTVQDRAPVTETRSQTTSSFQEKLTAQAQPQPEMAVATR